jgi:hypothetical protein
MLTAIGLEKFYGEHIRSGLSRDDRRTFATLPMATWSAVRRALAGTGSATITMPSPSIAPACSGLRLAVPITDLRAISDHHRRTISRADIEHELNWVDAQRQRLRAPALPCLSQGTGERRANLA